MDAARKPSTASTELWNRRIGSGRVLEWNSTVAKKLLTHASAEFSLSFYSPLYSYSHTRKLMFFTTKKMWISCPWSMKISSMKAQFLTLRVASLLRLPSLHMMEIRSRFFCLSTERLCSKSISGGNSQMAPIKQIERWYHSTFAHKKSWASKTDNKSLSSYLFTHRTRPQPSSIQRSLCARKKRTIKSLEITTPHQLLCSMCNL